MFKVDVWMKRIDLYVRNNRGSAVRCYFTCNLPINLYLGLAIKIPERSLAHSCDNAILHKPKAFIGETVQAEEAVLLVAYVALSGTKQRRESGGTITEAERLSI